MSNIYTLISKLEFIRDYECKTDAEIETINEAIAEFAELLPRSNWTLIGERLPEERGYYLVTDADGDVEIAWFRYDFDDKEPQWWLDGYGFIDVVAWMSFPGPYKVGEQDE